MRTAIASALAMAIVVTTAGCDFTPDAGSSSGSGTRPGGSTAPAVQPGALQFEIVAVNPYPRDMVGIQTKITNTGSVTVKQAEVTCVALDGGGREVGFARHYVLRGDGLAPGGVTYYDYVIDVANPQAVQAARYQVEQIR